MKVTKEFFVFELLKDLSGMKYAYRELIYGRIEELRETHSYECDATTEEIYDALMAVAPHLDSMLCYR